MKDDYAIVIGINEYPEHARGLHKLDAAVPDAAKIRKWLIEKGMVPADNCKHVPNLTTPSLQPVRDQVNDAMEAIFADIRENRQNKARRFYFYFAGHGLGIQGKKSDMALCMAKWNYIRIGEALSIEAYRELIMSCGLFTEAIFLLDCCRGTQIPVEPEEPGLQVLPPGPYAGDSKYFVCYGTQYKDESFEATAEDGIEKRGIFTEVLLEGLEGAAFDANGAILAQNLKDYLLKEVPTRAESKGYRQKPDVDFSFNAEHALFQQDPGESANVSCTIHFAQEEMESFDLVNGTGTILETIDGSLKPDYTVSLPRQKMLYLLRNRSGDRKFEFITTPAQTHIDVTVTAASLIG